MGSGKSQTVGFWYPYDLQFGLAYAADALLELRGGDATAWSGRITSNTKVRINAPNLWGGEDGGGEGGIVGDMHVLFGNDDQEPFPFLVSEFDQHSALRGKVTLLLQNTKYGAYNPYPKSPAVKVERVYAAWPNDEPWYPETARIGMITPPAIALYIALDISGSMGEETSNGQTRLANAQAAINGALDFVENTVVPSGTHVDVMIVGWGTQPSTRTSILRRAVGAADLAALRSWVSALTSTGGYWTYFPAGLLDLSGFVEGAPPGAERIGFFITDGSPTTSDSSMTPQEIAEAGADLVGAIGGLRMHAINIDLDDTTYTEYVDNTPEDGVPVLAGGDPGALTSVIVASMGGMYAMNPAHMLYYSKVSPTMEALPAATLDDSHWRAQADRLYAEGFGLCADWVPGAESVESFQQRICNVIGGALVKSRRDGMWRLNLARGVEDINSLPVLTDADILEWSEEPSVLEDAVNQLQTVWYDPQEKAERITPAEHALASIDAFGGIVSQTAQFREIPSEALALRVNSRGLHERSTPLRRISPVCGRRVANWESFTYFRLQSPKRGIADMVMLLLRVEVGETPSSAVKLVAVQDIYRMPETTYVQPQAPVDYNPPQIPLPVEHQRLIEVPYIDLAATLPHAELAALPPELGFVAAAAVRPGVGVNYVLMTAAEGEEYQTAGATDWCPSAVVPAGTDERQQTDFEITEGSRLDLVELGTAVLWDDEICRLDALDAEAGTISLGRGCADTVPAKHSAGSRLFFYGDWSGTDGREYGEGETVHAKALTRTSSAQLPLESASAMSVVMAGRHPRPYPPARLRINGEAYPEEASGELVVSWAHRDRLLQQDQLLDSEAASFGPEPGVTYNVRFLLDSLQVGLQTGVDSDQAAPFTPDQPGTLMVEVESQLGELVSWQKLRHSLVYGAVEPVPWTFEALGQKLAFWINDDSDLEVSGSAVLSVADLSVRGLDSFAPSSGVRPTYIDNELNGRRVLAFSGSQYLDLPSEAGSIFRLVPAGWFAGVFKLSPGDTGNQERPVVVFNAGSSISIRAGLLASQSNGTNQPGVGGRRTDGDSYSGAMSSSAYADQWVMAVGFLDYQGRVIELWLDGDLDTKVTGAWAAAGDSANSESSVARVGANAVASPTTFFRGHIAEVACGIGDLSEADIARAFGYMADRWGMQANLGADHPYRNSAPTYLPAAVLAGFPHLLKESPRLCMAHRGAAYLYPEHTNVAYAECIASGEPLIEQDVFLTADGSVVCTHDATATYTTTSTASFSSLTDAQVDALVVDSDTWHGATFSGLKIPLYRDVIDAHIANAVFVSEGKTSAALAQAVVELDDASVPLGQVLLCSFDASNPATAATALAPAVSAGRPALLSSATADATTQALGAGIGYVGYRKDVSPGFISRSLANGLGVVAFTVNRRFEARQLFRRGVQGVFTDDPVYLRSEGPLATSDTFDTGRWMSGMVAGSDDSARPSLAARGRMLAPDAWGWTETADNQQGCLQGWACPVKGDDYADDFTIDFKLTFDSTPGNAARWVGCFIADGSELDRAYPFLPGSSSPAISGYLILVRKNGTLDVFRRTGQTDVSIASQSGATIATGVEVRFRVVVTPSAIAIQRLTSGGSVDYQASAADTTFRGGYFHLGKYGVACRFREITVS